MEFEHIPNGEIQNHTGWCYVFFSRMDQYFEDLANLFKALIKFGFIISPHKYQFSRDHLTYMGLQFMLKDGKPSYTAVREKCNAIRNLKPLEISERLQIILWYDYIFVILPWESLKTLDTHLWDPEKENLNGLKIIRDHLTSLKNYW